jgi:phage-related protein
MKTLVIRNGPKHVIRAVATEAPDGGRDRCETLAFLQEHRVGWPEELEKLGAVLSETAESGPPQNEKKFKKLPGTSGLYEFKSPQGLRLICFWDAGGVIICTHGYVKDGQKAPKRELDRGQRIMRDYFNAKKNGSLTHVEQKRKAV